MGLTDFLRSQFIEIIEWTDDSRDTLSYRFPDDDKEIKRGAQLIVRESQNVQFVYLKGSYDLILQRLQARKSHFMRPELLKSQFDAMEEPGQALIVDIEQTPAAIVRQIRQRFML